MPAFEKTSVNVPFRVNLALVAACVCFFIVGVRLWYLQILRGEFFRDKSENNRLRQVFIAPPRGIIKDRDGEVLVKNRPSFEVDFVTEDSPNPRETIEELAKIAQQDPEILMQSLKAQRRRRPFEPKLVLKDISRDLVAKIIARRSDLPGVLLNVVPAREYIYGDLGAHVLGYIREINRQQLDSPKYPGYRSGDIVGQTGIEARWEKYLQGQRGVQLVVVNATGAKIGESSFEPDRPGHNITLTLDLDVQKAADEGLKDKKGAIVAMDPNTGEILALASAPRFDPNMFTSDVSAEAWEDLVSGKEHKLNNRAVQGTYPPGSVFKVFMSIAAQAENIMSQRESVFCPGHMQVGRRTFHCHKKSGHGTVDHHGAMVQSCDVYFYTVGQRLGVDRIHEYAKRFGLGEVTGLELVEESAGLIPSTEWKRTHFKRPENQKWYPGETPSVAIGQGAVTTTPLQITRGIAAVANGGKLFKPYLVKKIESIDGSFLDDDFHPEIVRTVDIDKNIVNLIRQDMEGVVSDAHGTGKRASLKKEFDISVAGKTGTAQVVSLDVASTAAHHGDHAWFSAFAPLENPEIVVTALVENGGHGGVAAAPLVKQVMMAYFSKRRERLDKGESATVPPPLPEGGAD